MNRKRANYFYKREPCFAPKHSELDYTQNVTCALFDFYKNLENNKSRSTLHVLLYIIDLLSSKFYDQTLSIR